MADAAPGPTELLLAWGRGDKAALDRLVPMVHHELLRMARRFMAGERPHHTIQATALVNEAYLRLIQIDRVNWQNRAHFFAVAARLMRRVLVDAARARGKDKRGGGMLKLSLDETAEVLGVSRDTVKRDWRFAKLWILREMKRPS
jgi:RNA polymerase sigma factor (TIGR02999 family)